MQKMMIFLLIIFLSFTINLSICFAGINRAAGLFLLADYPSAIQECQNIISQNPSLDEAAQGYLILGLSQIKDARYDEAATSFQKLIDKFPKHKLVQRAQIGLADTYFLKEDFQVAVNIYSGVLKDYSSSDMKSVIYFKLGQVNLKLGKWQEAHEYLEKAQDEFPASLVSGLATKLLEYEYFFTIQIGSFKEYPKAKSLADQLAAKGYEAYTIESRVDADTFYRVRVGKLSGRQEAVKLKDELSRQGYPTIIYP